MKGIHPYGGMMRCPHCKTRRQFIDKKQGQYAFAVQCKICNRVISPLSDTIFRQTNIHLSAWLKAMLILKIRQPDILMKDLAVTLNVTLSTTRGIKRKIMSLKDSSLEYRLFKTMEPLISENFTFIFSENAQKREAVL